MLLGIYLLLLVFFPLVPSPVLIQILSWKRSCPALKKRFLLCGICGVSTDGATVMVGHKSGVITRLKEKVNGILATYCIAHPLALACSSGADSIPYLVKVQEVLNNIYNIYFNRSPKNMAMPEAV